MLDGGNAIVLLLNSVSVEDQNVGLWGAAILTITLCGLLVSKGFDLVALNVRVTALTFETFQAKVIDGVSGGRTGVLDPATHAARDDAARGDDKAGSQQHIESP